MTAERVLEDTRSQSPSTRRFPKRPECYWVDLIADSLTCHHLLELVAGQWTGPRSWHRGPPCPRSRRIDLITDRSNGEQYVGKADGAERILGRWMSYARDRHGGNQALRELAAASAGDGISAARTSHAQ